MISNTLYEACSRFDMGLIQLLLRLLPLIIILFNDKIEMVIFSK